MTSKQRLAQVIPAVLLIAGCATVGKEFPTQQVPTIQVGKTTMEQIKETFGSPWRTGIESGKRTWTYGQYQYKLFGDSDTTDLVIRFSESGTVISYNYNTTNHSE